MRSKILLYCTNQIRIMFSDEIGNPPKTMYGTGFWVGTENKAFFVTNAHNLNPKMHKKLEKYELAKLEILLRLKKMDYGLKVPAFLKLISTSQ